MIIRDKLGWPVVRIKNRPVLTAIRYILIGDIYQTWRLRHEGCPQQEPDQNVQQGP